MSVKTIREQFEEELVLFKTNVQLMVKDIFTTEKTIEPMLFTLIIKEDKLVVAILGGMGAFFNSDEGKMAAAQVMRKFNKEMKPLATAFVCEGWARILNIEDTKSYVNADGDLVDPLNIRPSQADDKKEVLMFMFETYDKEASVHYEIKRKPYDEEDAELHKVMDMDWASKKEGHVGGIMADLLQDNYDVFAQMIKNINNKENLN